jgi:hypothetical protein
MIVSNDPNFIGADWENFAPSKAWNLSAGDGTKTVYAQFRSSTGNLSNTYSDTVTLDGAESCGQATEDNDNVDEPTPTEDEGEASDDTEDVLDAGDFIRTEDDGTVYYVMPDDSLRPLPDLQTYLSFTGLCGTFTYVDEADIGLGPYGSFLLPRANSVLVKFPLDARVYVVADDGLDTGVGTLRWVASEEAAVENFGAAWNDYVVTLLPSENFTYTLGTEITGFETDLADDQMLTRASLNQAITYDLYIVNPDGTKRSAFSEWGRIEETDEETLVYGIEDKGLDNDYNDVVIDLDPRQCLQVNVEVRPLEAAWHHQIGMAVYYEGILRQDFILWNDSHAAVGQNALIDLTLLDVNLNPLSILFND